MATILFLAYFLEIVIVKSVTWLHLVAKGLLPSFSLKHNSEKSDNLSFWMVIIIIQQYRGHNQDLVNSKTSLLLDNNNNHPER